MLKPILRSIEGTALPGLEAAYMVTSVKDVEPGATDETGKGVRSSKPAALVVPRQSVYNSRWRSGRLLSWFIPPLLGLFILYGWQFASRFIIPYLCETQSALVCKTYSVLLHTLLTLTVGLFVFLWITPNHHSAPPSALPLQVKEQLIPHQTASADGGYNECWQDDCQGRILPPRARHCKDCRRCRLEFDHHCPWVGCISRDTTKAFILFLGMATFAIIVGLAPVYGLALKQLRFVTGLLWEDEWMYREWWSSKWSWLGGPVTRYVGAVAICYLYYEAPAYLKPEDYPTGDLPISMTLLFYCFYGTILGVFCIVMFIGTVKDVIQASSTIEATRANRQNKAGLQGLYSFRYIQMPQFIRGSLPAGEDAAHRVQEVPVHIRLYDFGRIENLRRVFGRSPCEWASPWPPRIGSAEHWRLGPYALAYLDMPAEQKETNRKID